MLTHRIAYLLQERDVGERFGLMPEIFIASDQQSPAVFMNDEHRIKVRHFLAVWVNDYRPLYKANVAG